MRWPLSGWPVTSPDVAALLAQIGRLDNRPETIGAMQRGLDAAWSDLEQADGCPVIAEAFAEQRQAFGYSSGPDLASRRTANAGATVIHRSFIPPISNQATSGTIHRWLRWMRRWVPWSAEVRDYR